MLTDGSKNHCILHVTEDIDEKLKTFTEKTWEKIKCAAQIRRNKPKFNESNTYWNVIHKLPDDFSSQDLYHSSCYSKFTSISIDAGKLSETISSMASTSGRNKIIRSGSKETTPKICIFCQKEKKYKNKKCELLSQILTKTIEASIREDARKLEDFQMLEKVLERDLIAEDVMYHRSCRSAYSMKAQREDCKTSSDNTGTNISWSTICEYVNDFIVNGKRIESLMSVYKRFITYCEESDEDLLYSTPQYFCTKLKETFDTKLIIDKSKSRRHGVVIYSSSLQNADPNLAYHHENHSEGIIEKAALILRKEIGKIQSRNIPEDFTFDDYGSLIIPPPELLYKFFGTLYNGIDIKVSESVEKKVQSTCSDVMFVVSCGRVKPLKQIAMGVAIKSMTGSKKLLTILNRLGHCVNYSYVEELETEVAMNIINTEKCCPLGAVKNAIMGVAFDNYDEITNTFSGSDSLHDTNGILYQNARFSNETQPVHEPRSTVQKISGSRKRTLDCTESLLEPYTKIPRMSKFSYIEYNVSELLDPTGINYLKDNIWLMTHSLCDEETPMWVGFNARTDKTNLESQNVFYLPNIEKPITRNDVVQETLKIAQNCAKECNQQYALVTYDLAAAKIASQIQITESPRFDDVFIMFGAFHIQLCFFKAIGKFIGESGGPEILVESGILAPGSLNGIINGSYFNRCKRLHGIFSLALEKLLFETFCKEDYLPENINQVRSILSNSFNDRTHFSALLEDPIINDVNSKYIEFKNSVLCGKLGSTAVYWMLYIDYINNYRLFDRAIRTNNLDLYIFSLTKFIDLFFATNHQNYARWLTKYQLDLMNIDNNFPGLRHILESGGLTVQRTDKAFSRSPIDLVVEQTVNADCASRLTGIASMTNNFSARLRHMVTKTNRGIMVNKLLDLSGLCREEDATAELQSWRIKKDNEDVKLVLDVLRSTCNPFLEFTEYLINILTGIVTSNEVESCLLNIQKKGNDMHAKFIEECVNDSSRFEKPIKRQKLATFANQCASNLKHQNSTIATLKSTNSLIGRLLALASEKNVDMKHILQFPLTPVPLSLFNGDGSMNKTRKSALFDKLTTSSTEYCNEPQNIDVYMIDGNFMLHMISSRLPTSISGISKVFLEAVLNNKSKEVHIVFDEYKTPSLKGQEHERRSSTSKYKITGSSQKIGNFQQALKSDSFKKQLPVYFISEWEKLEFVSTLGSKILYVNIQQKCYKFSVEENKIVRNEIEELANNHDEGDTKLCLHCAFIDSAKNVVIRANDTDIAIILLHHIKNFVCNVWMLTGLASKNTLKYTNVTKLGRALGTDLCDSLPLLHSLTGCDFTSAFYLKGKSKAFTILQESLDFQKSFSHSVIHSQTAPVMKSIEQFVCKLYDVKTKESSVNNLRYDIFLKYCGVSSCTAPLKKIRNFSARSMPPCSRELICHVSRSIFISKIWHAANTREINLHPTRSDGWSRKEEVYDPIPFDGPQVPDTLCQEEIQSEESDDEELEPLLEDLFDTDDL